MKKTTVTQINTINTFESMTKKAFKHVENITFKHKDDKIKDLLKAYNDDRLSSFKTNVSNKKTIEVVNNFYNIQSIGKSLNSYNKEVIEKLPNDTTKEVINYHLYIKRAMSSKVNASTKIFDKAFENMIKSLVQKDFVTFNKELNNLIGLTLNDDIILELYNQYECFKSTKSFEKWFMFKLYQKLEKADCTSVKIDKRLYNSFVNSLPIYTKDFAYSTDENNIDKMLDDLNINYKDMTYPEKHEKVLNCIENHKIIIKPKEIIEEEEKLSKAKQKAKQAKQKAKQEKAKQEKEKEEKELKEKVSSKVTQSVINIESQKKAKDKAIKEVINNTKNK